LPEEDTKYFGSFRDKTFNPTEKTILFVCETREEAMEIEIELHDFFDVAVNPQFANRSKQTSTRFDSTGVPRTEAQKQVHSEKMIGKNVGKTRTEEQKKAQSERNSGEKNPMYGVPRTEETKKKMSVAKSGEKNHMFGVPKTEEWKKAMSERMSGEKNPGSKAIIAIKPDGTQRHFVSGTEAARELEIDRGNLCKYLKYDHALKQGKFEGWQFLFENR